MKWIFALIFAFATLLAVIAYATMPDEKKDGAVCTLVWATDDNPARVEQMELFRKWHQEKYGEKIEIRTDPSNRDFSKIVVQSLAGAGPDVFDFYGVSELERYLSSGILLDVTEEANRMGFNKEVAWDAIWPSFVSNGRQYGFPDNVASVLIIYHKDAFDKAGIPYPAGDWTWGQFLEVAKKLSYDRGRGLRQYAIMDFNPMPILYQNGAKLFTPHGTKCIIDSPEAIEALQFYEDLRLVHRVMPTAADLASQSSVGGWGGNWVNLFATGYFAMAVGGRFWYIGFNRDAISAEAHGKSSPYNLGVAEQPFFKRKYGEAGARCTGISRTSKNVRYAYHFLEYLASEPFNRQINRTFDALAPVKKYCTGEQGIADGPAPSRGLESANDPIWAQSMEYCHEMECSPFIPPYRVTSLWEEWKQTLDAGDVTPEQMLHQLAKRINEEMQSNVSKSPELKKKYKAALAMEKELAQSPASDVP
jgi:multiple sugar transport system substrate-binding protein